MAGVQEMNWFGTDVGPAVDGYIMLHSGRSIPQDSTAVVRREGVGIILNSTAAPAWRAIDEVLNAVSSRLITTRVGKRWQ